jgi:hypothetical protein
MVTYRAGTALKKQVSEGKIEGRSDGNTRKKRYAATG